MGGWLVKLLKRNFVSHGCVFMLCFMASVPAWSACPKLLMSGGVHIWKQNNASQAFYWGQTVGVQGFLVNYIVSDWEMDVGSKPNARWNLVRSFQSTYAAHGVTDNFIKVGLYHAHDWRNGAQNRQTVTDLGHAAALAKYAGFKGVALDLEPYKPTWGNSSGGPRMAATVQKIGREVAEAMHSAYPGMTLVVLPDVLRQVEREKTQPAGWADNHNGGYGLSAAFVRGLLSVRWSRVVVGTEYTYTMPAGKIAPAVQDAAHRYLSLRLPGDTNANFSVAPGLWPLGPSKNDKSARMTPVEFQQRLQASFDVSNQYAWIYGSNSAWQKNGPLGPIPGPVTRNFQNFLDAIRWVRTTCERDSASAQDAGSSTTGTLPPRIVTVPSRPVEPPPRAVAASRMGIEASRWISRHAFRSASEPVVASWSVAPSNRSASVPSPRTGSPATRQASVPPPLIGTFMGPMRQQERLRQRVALN